jgi:hypothetical protein
VSEILTEHTNSEGEKVSIERATHGAFAGRLLLVIHDDPPVETRAPMLLDEGTRDWLLGALSGYVDYTHGTVAFHDPVPLRRDVHG